MCLHQHHGPGLDMLLQYHHYARWMGLKDRLRRHSIQGRAVQIDDCWWAMIEPPFEERVVDTRAFVLALDKLAEADANPRQRTTGASVFLTTKTLVVAVDPPFPAAQAGLMRTKIADIQRLVIAPNGALIVLGPGDEDEGTGTVLSLYPNPISQQLIAELRSRWKECTGQEIEGNR